MLLIGFAVLQQAARLEASYLSKNVGWLATNQLRAELTLHCLRLDMYFHKAHTPGDLIERFLQIGMLVDEAHSRASGDAAD